MRLFPFVLIAIAGLSPVWAQQNVEENFNNWPLLKNPFESTGGGGVMIDGYNPVISGNLCRTDFSVKMPSGEVFQNIAEFDAVATQGGILCTNGRWKAKDGSGQGTTPFRVFLRDGVARRSP